MPLSNSTFTNSLLAALKPAAEGGIPHLSTFYCQLLEMAEASAQAAALPYVNALAFGTRDFLPQMWRRAAIRCALSC